MRKIILAAALSVLACSCTRSGFIPTTGGACLYYEMKGRGEPLILLHGHSLDTRMWDPQFDEFAKRYKVVRFDFRGYGRSSMPEEGFQFTHLDDLLTVMDSLRIDKAHIVGLSMGAFVGFDMLGLQPGRMLSSVMASGDLKTYKGPSEPMDSVEKAARDASIAALKAKGVDKMKAEWLEGLVSSGGSQRESIRGPLAKMIGDWTAWQPLHYEPRVICAADAAKEFYSRRPEVPVLIIRDMHASGEPKELQYLPNGEYVKMEDCGHMMNMEKPAAFNKLVLDFISSR